MGAGGPSGKRWYHISTTWDGVNILVRPQPGRRDSDSPLDLKACICVAPSVAQCVVALGGFGDLGVARIYATTGLPRPAHWVWDYPVTGEHRFYRPKTFRFISEIDLSTLALNLQVLKGTLAGIQKALDKGDKGA